MMCLVYVDKHNTVPIHKVMYNYNNNVTGL